MVLSDSGIGESLYLFTERHSQCVNGIYVAAGIIALSLLLSLMQYKLHPEWRVGAKWSPLILCGSVAGGVMIHLWLDMRENDRIFKNHAETIGITLSKDRHRSGACTVHYQFKVDNKTYDGEGITHVDPGLINIKVPQGTYKVIYNSKDPSESMMDLGDNWSY